LSDETELTPEILLRAYAVGIFPMGQSAEDRRLAWFDPDPRGILPLDRFHLPRRLARTMRTTHFTVTADIAFEAVIDECASAVLKRPTTWISGRLRAACVALHRMGFAHSIEIWNGDTLVGGLYGVALGGAFFGESMFSRARDASKIALVHLVARLRAGGFVLLDTQFATMHLMQFGTVEIPRAEYRSRLATALRQSANFHCAGVSAALASLVQSTTDMS